MVDLGVDSGGGNAAVAQNLSHFGKRRARPQHLGCRRVAKPMGSETAEPRPLAGGSHHLAHTCGSEPTQQGEHPQEHLALGAPGAASAEIGGYRRSDVGRQWQTLLGVPLAPHDDLSSSPLDVIEAEGRDFGGSQPEAGEQHQDGVVAPADRAAPIAAGQQRRYLSGSKTPRQRGAAPSRRGRNRTRQRHDDRALET
jgi:hypothetical protein